MVTDLRRRRGRTERGGGARDAGSFHRGAPEQSRAAPLIRGTRATRRPPPVHAL